MNIVLTTGKTKYDISEYIGSEGKIYRNPDFCKLLIGKVMIMRKYRRLHDIDTLWFTDRKTEVLDILKSTELFQGDLSIYIVIPDLVTMINEGYNLQAVSEVWQDHCLSYLRGDPYTFILKKHKDSLDKYARERDFWKHINIKNTRLNERVFGEKIDLKHSFRSPIKIVTTYDSINALEQRMLTEKKVFYVRFGDNCLQQIVGTDKKGNPLTKPIGNNKTKWSEELMEDMRGSFTIKDPNYMKAVVGCHEWEEGMEWNIFHPQPDKWIEASIMGLTDERSFYHATMFHYLFTFKPERLKGWINNTIKGKKVAFIGSVNNPDKLFGDIKYYIPTPDKNSYTSLESTLGEVVLVAKDVDVIISCSGQLTRAIAHYLWELPYNFHYIDFGSAVSYFDGDTNRYWLKNINRLKTWNQW